MAKILFHFLKDLSRSEDTFSFLMPQYATTIGDAMPTVDDEGITDVEAERRKQEESLRQFRMKESNLLVSNSLIEVGIDSVRYVETVGLMMSIQRHEKSPSVEKSSKSSKLLTKPIPFVQSYVLYALCLWWAI